MAAEIMRSGLAGLAMWWSEHPHVAREQVVATAVDVLWDGLASAVGGAEASQSAASGSSSPARRMTIWSSSTRTVDAAVAGPVLGVDGLSATAGSSHRP